MKDELNVPVLVIFMSFLFLLTSNAIAQDKKWYAGSAIGYGKIDGSDSVTARGVTVEGDYGATSPAVKIYGGRKLYRYFGVEGSFIYGGSYSDDFLSYQNLNVPVSVDDELELSGYGVTVDGKGHLPISESFDLFARLGLAYFYTSAEWEATYNTPIGTTTQSLSSSGGDFGLTYGIGGNYNLNEQFSIRAELQWIDSFESGGDGIEEGVGFDPTILFAGAHYKF